MLRYKRVSVLGATVVAVAWVLTSFLVRPCFASAALEGSELIPIADFGVGKPGRVQVDSTVIEDRVFVAIIRDDQNSSVLAVSEDCELAMTPQTLADNVLPSRKPGGLTMAAVGGNPFVLLGDLKLEAFVQHEGTWQRKTVVRRQESGILLHRTVAVGGDAIYVAMLEMHHGKRQSQLAVNGRVVVEPAERRKALRVLTLDADELSLRMSEEIDLPYLSLDSQEALSMAMIDGVPAILLAIQPPSGEGILELLRKGSDGWSRSLVHRFDSATPPLVLLGEEGAYSRRERVGLYRFGLEVKGTSRALEAWDDWSPESLASSAGVLAWTDTRRAGRRWWGRLPLHQLWNPNESPKWLNNDIVIDRDDPKILTPWPVRVEQIRVHSLASRGIVIWLGYDNFNGRAEAFETRPLELFCQAFDWKDVS